MHTSTCISIEHDTNSSVLHLRPYRSLGLSTFLKMLSSVMLNMASVRWVLKPQQHMKFSALKWYQFQYFLSIMNIPYKPELRWKAKETALTHIHDYRGN